MPVIDFPAVTAPTKIRIKNIRIFNGVNKTVLQPNIPAGGFSETPLVVLDLVGVNPLYDGFGEPLLNIYGQPMYEDTGFISRLEISDPAVLGSFIASIWESLMGAGYDLVDENLPILKWIKDF